MAEEEEVGEDGHQMIWSLGSYVGQGHTLIKLNWNVGILNTELGMSVHGQGSARTDTDREVFACPQYNGLY